MAYFTVINFGRVLTEAEQASLDNYTAGQVTAGTTDGNLYEWTVNSTDGQPISTNKVRMWSTLESGNGFLAIGSTFTPPPVSTKIY